MSPVPTSAALTRIGPVARTAQLRTQVSIDRVGEVDFLIGDRLIIECDGKENHDGNSQRHKDLLRDAAAAALGYETLRLRRPATCRGADGSSETSYASAN